MFEREVLFFICIDTLHLACMDVNVVVCAFDVILFFFNVAQKCS